jgi:DNA-binding CsgD family transcriptional regulator
MTRSVSLDVFRTFATVLSDASGEVAFGNRKAAKLLGCSPRRMTGQRCWETMGLVDPNGARFCGPNCPVQRQTRRGALRPRHRVVSRGRDRRPVEFDMLTFPVPPRTSGRQAILHVLLPVTAEEIEHAGPAHERLSRLTARQAETLRLLASGCDTETIAARLGISPTTVRNHVQHVLAKLEVHDRLQAILTLLRSRSADAK